MQSLINQISPTKTSHAYDGSSSQLQRKLMKVDLQERGGLLRCLDRNAAPDPQSPIAP